MTLKSRRGAIVVAALLSSLALVAGVASPASAAPPVPLVNLDCQKLATATDPTAAFATPPPQRYPAAMDLAHVGGIPDSDVIRMAGGLVCEWSNGGSFYGDHAATVGVRIQYLPGDEAGYWQWASGWVTTPESFECTTGPDWCVFATSEGGDFLYATTIGATSAAVAESLLRRINTAIQLGATTTYVAPPYAFQLGHTCRDVVRPEVWRAAVASLRPIVANALPGNSARDRIRALYCLYDEPSYSQTAGTLYTLPGGRWSFLVLSPILTRPGALTAMTVPGMRPGDTAYTRCDPVHNHCILDALIATHWIEVDLPAVSASAHLIRADRLDALRVILSEIVLQVYSP